MQHMLLTFLLMASALAFADIKAITDEGDVVILSQDGSWSYESKVESSQASIPTNDGVFTVPSASNFELKSTKTAAVFSIDASKWSFTKSDSKHSSAEYTFDFKNGDLYAMVISEQVEIAVEELVKIAFDNAKSVATNVKVIKKEYRKVNDINVIYMEMTGEIQTIKFKYFGYYHSNAAGSTQFLAYTGEGLEGKYRANIDDFLNGFSSRTN